MIGALKRICAAVVLAPAAWGAGPATALELEDLIEEALANNPSLAALRHRLAAAEARIPQAGALTDPMFKFELSNVPLSDFDFDSTPMSGKQFVVWQKLPYWGKRAAREEMAVHAAGAVAASLQDREGVIVNLVKQAYFTLAFLDRSIDITEKNRALLQDLIHIAQTKYAVGRGLQQDVLKAQVSLSSLDVRLIVLRQRRGRAEAQLNTALNRMPQAPVGATVQRPVTPFALDVESVQEAALQSRPMLSQIEERIGRWRAAEELARREQRPDFEVSFGYRQRDFDREPVAGSDFLSLGVALNLPIYQGRKQDQRVLEARAQIRAEEAEYDNTKQQILLQIQQLHIDIGAHREEAALFRTAMIPQADQSLTSAMAGYQVDKVDFLTLLNNQVTRFDFEIEYYRHLTEYERSLARLEAAVGKRLF